MASDRSRQKLLDFLDYLAAKGLMAPATISARRAAAGKVLGLTKSAVDDFRTYLENPLGFRPSVQARDRRKPEGKKEDPAPTSASKQTNVERDVMKAPPLSSSILPIPIRPDVTVFVQGLPYDLTEAEANKIANVIRAMATPS